MTVQVRVVTSLDEAKTLVSQADKREPFVLRGFDLGACCTKWTVQYLQSVVREQQVKIHVVAVENMDFLNKNFLYRTLPFNELIGRASRTVQNAPLADCFISADEKYYLRSLGADERKDRADIKKQFPELTGDINFPPLFDESRFFSSVFRISSAHMRLWTHYDIVGRKRVVLFAPSDVHLLYMKGDKSRVLDIDTPDLAAYPLFAEATRYECELIPGDAIFIPALWLHNVLALTYSVGVNVFWKNLSDSVYEKNDVYGNKDLQAASRAFLFVEKSMRELNTLPTDYREFYTKRLMQMLTDSLHQDNKTTHANHTTRSSNLSSNSPSLLRPHSSSSATCNDNTDSSVGAQ